MERSSFMSRYQGSVAFPLLSKQSISISVKTRTFLEGCCPGGRTTKIPAGGGG